MKISTKINLIFISIFGSLFLITSLVVINYTVDIFRNKVFENLYYGGRTLTEHVRTYLNDQKITAGVLAEASVFRDFLKESSSSAQYKTIKSKVDARLLRTVNIDNNISEVFILDKDGKVLSSSDKKQEGKDKSSDSYFTNGQKEVYIKDIYFSKTTNKNNYAISAPIKDEKDKLLGVSVLRFNTNDLNNIFKDFGYPEKTKEAFLINKDLYFITPSLFLGDSVVLNKIVDTKNARDCFDPDEVAYITKNGYSGLNESVGKYQQVEAKDYRQVDVLGTHNYIPETGWCLVTKIDKSEFLNITNPINDIFIISSLITLILLIIVGRFLSKKISKPIKELNESVKIVSQGNLDIKVGNKSKDEIGELSRSFDEMTSNLKDSKQHIEEKIKARTLELEEINQHMVNRELKMIELKQKVKELEKNKNDA